MTQKHLSLLFLLLMPFSLKALDARTDSLSAEDLAAFMGIRHRIISFSPRDNVQSISYFVDVYRDGKYIATVKNVVDAALKKNNPEQRIVIIFKEEGRMVKMKLQGGKSGIGFEFEKPNGVDRFPYTAKDVKFDEKGRLVLAFDLKKNEKGGIIFTEENQTPEGAKAALVLRIEMQ